MANDIKIGTHIPIVKASITSRTAHIWDRNILLKTLRESSPLVLTLTVGNAIRIIKILSMLINNKGANKMNNEFRILRLERKNNSVNGNPKYEVYYIDSNGDFGHATTQSDAGFCYGITNDMRSASDPQVIAKLEFTKSGRVSDLEVIKKLHKY